MSLFRRNVLLPLFFCAFAATGAAAQTTLKFGHTNPSTSEFGHAAKVFSEEVAKRTSGRYKIEVFPNSQLGGEREMVESVQLGTLDLVLTTTGPIGNFVPEVGIVDIPFLYNDAAHARAVFDGPIGQDLLKKFPAKGMVALAWGDQGFRHLTNSKRAVRTPADAKGLKIRTMENPVHILAFNTLGMQATPMAWPEVIPGLQQGVVDGAELPVSPMAILKWWEFQKHVTLDGHVFSPMLFIMATKPHSALSAQDKEAFAAAAKSAGAAQRKFVDDREKENLALLKSHGIQVVEQIDKAQWRAVLKPAYDSYAKKYGQANIDRIINFKK